MTGKTVIKSLTVKELNKMLSTFKTVNQLPAEVIEKLKSDGWEFGDYHMEKVYKGIPLVIEFCIGDFCTYPCSKRGHWILQTKFKATTWLDAMIYVQVLQDKIDNGFHWQGEEN